MSDIPILSHPLSATPAPPRPSERPDEPPSRPTTFISPPPIVAPIKNKKGNLIKHRSLVNSTRAGLSDKKLHEVSRMSRLFTRLREEDPELHCVVDVGSGRGHLSRVLAFPPFNAHVLAIDFDEGQKKGAERLDALRLAALEYPEAEGSLTHIVRRVDKESLIEILKKWPHDTTAGGENPTEKTMLVALHACGDLTVETLRAFVESDNLENERKMIAVGCCYTHLSPSSTSLYIILLCDSH